MTRALLLKPSRCAGYWISMRSLSQKKALLEAD